MTTKTTKTPQTDFDDDELEMVTRPTNESQPTTTEDGIPYCPKHHCQMKQTSGGKAGSLVAYFGCPVDGCHATGKRIKAKRSVVPAEPLTCHRCASVSPLPIMERDEKASTAMYTILKCPVCQHKSQPLPRPEFAERHAEARKVLPVAELGAR